jgi:hypothetical protein
VDLEPPHGGQGLENVAVMRRAQPDPGAGWNAGCGAAHFLITSS